MFKLCQHCAKRTDELPQSFSTAGYAHRRLRENRPCRKGPSSNCPRNGTVSDTPLTVDGVVEIVTESGSSLRRRQGEQD
jgi:hypothetical protein